MGNTVRWGILGASNFALNQMAPSIHAADNAVLAALATTSPHKAAGFEALAPGLRLHDGYDALLADPQIDAVYVPLPNTAHAPYAEKAMRAGKAVLVEKPIGMNVAEIDALIATSAETGCLCAEAYMPVHHPQWAKLRELLAAGAVGQLRMIRGLFTFTLGDQSNIRAQADLGGGGIRDVGIYPIGMSRFAMGAEPDQITSHIQMSGGVDVLAEIRGMFGDVVFSAVCGTSAMRAQSMEFHGTEGMIRMPAPFNPVSFAEASVVLDRPDFTSQTWRFPAIDQYKLQVEAFGRSMQTDVDYPVPLSFSRGSQAVIDASFANARVGEL